MRERCPTGFEERLLSAYLDGELTQGEEQRVELHVEDCTHCKALLGELGRIREATMNTTFATPPDDQWDELPRTPASGIFRRLGWWLVVPWLVLVTAWGLWEAWRGSVGVLERVLVFGGLGGMALLFLSVLLDRIRSAATDRYREVKR